ncbi:hypothetical protein B0H67DRAFT_155 [Lasiosphaeris hirsuta]|uniref:Uncharacterized protein n=1 Tax=Lasiosphaeris hirsuta TaxID=260670 RepID=A0AA40E753_9PEZI|nr:hypothetical protein B0H67DRAFT_155 [Lasiosphaeris hirsuta]
MPGSPTIFAASIPNITALRNDLDYGDARLPRCATFNDDTRAFRRKFKTSHGVDGVDLYDWRSQVSQAGLNEMTMAYLDKEGNGELFWPDDKSSKNYNQYHYSKDRDRIRRLVKQLFFRLNQQQFRNQKYKNKDNSDAREDDDNRGRNRQTAIDVESTINHGSPRSNEESATVESATADLSNFDQMYDGLPVLDGVDEDVFEVPESNPTSPPMHPQRMRQFESINQPSRTKRSLPTAPDPGHPDQQSWKRQKKPPKAGLTRPVTTSNVPNPQKRESPRTNKARGVQKEGYMMGTDALDKITKAVSPERGPSLQRQGVSSRPRQSPTPETPTISFRSPRASKPMQRLGYATGLNALNNITKVVSLERQHSPQQPDGPSRLRRSLTPEAPTITFRGTADHMRESPPSDSGGLCRPFQS